MHLIDDKELNGMYDTVLASNSSDGKKLILSVKLHDRTEVLTYNVNEDGISPSNE